jgi:uncharacterized protein
MMTKSYITKILMPLFTVIVMLISLHASNAYADFDNAVEAIHSANGRLAQNILEPLVKKGNAQAQSLLGTLLLEGIFVEKNIPRAKELILNAAAGGDPHAKYQVNYLAESENKIQNISLELEKKYLREAAEAGHPRAQYSLGVGLLFGTPFKQDIEEARQWNSKAIENKELLVNETNIIFQFPSLLSGKIPSTSQFIETLEESANYGFPTPAFTLGILYLNGRGVPPEPHTALKWFTIASYSEHEKAAEYVKELTNLLGSKKGVSDPWFIEHSKNKHTAYGLAAKWCVEEKISNIRCLRNALHHHDNCLPPYFPDYFNNYFSSIGYRYCREKYLRDFSIE